MKTKNRSFIQSRILGDQTEVNADVGAGLQVAVALREVSGDELLHQRLGVLVEVPAGNEPPWDQGLRVCNSRTLRLRICKV